MADHTPGPWSWQLHGGNRVLYNASGGSMAQSITSDANARLISAAPDLLAALLAEKAKVAYLFQYGGKRLGVNFWPWTDDETGILDVDTDAAIAKATGASE